MSPSDLQLISRCDTAISSLTRRCTNSPQSFCALATLSSSLPLISVRAANSGVVSIGCSDQLNELAAVPNASLASAMSSLPVGLNVPSSATCSPPQRTRLLALSVGAPPGPMVSQRALMCVGSIPYKRILAKDRSLNCRGDSAAPAPNFRHRCRQRAANRVGVDEEQPRQDLS